MTDKFFATCPKSLEGLLEEELIRLGATTTKQTVAGVYFTAAMEVAYKVCLWSRFANRILFPLSTFKADDAEALYRGASQISWARHLSTRTTFLVNFTGTSDTIRHTQFAAQKIKDAIVDQFRKKQGDRPTIDKKNPDLRLNASLRKGEVTLSIDLSGDSLHRRGYRLDGGEAPLKENLAAAILQRANWPEIAKKGGSLLDPMCGSGTLLIEGLLMAADIAPGLYRKKFGFHGWKQHQEKIWSTLVEEASARAKKGKQSLLASIFGIDIDEDVLRQAESNIKRIGLSAFIKLQQSDIKQLRNKDIRKMYGLCICNPPYGERLEESETLLPLYRAFSRTLKENFLNWEAAMLTGNTEIARKMGLRAYKKYAFYNGAIPCQLLLFHIQPEWFIEESHSKCVPE